MYKRRTQNGVNGSRKTETWNTKTGRSSSQSTSNGKTRQTFSRRADGTTTITTTRNLGNGWFDKSVRYLGGTKYSNKATKEDALFRSLATNPAVWIICLIIIILI